MSAEGLPEDEAEFGVRRLTLDDLLTRALEQEVLPLNSLAKKMLEQVTEPDVPAWTFSAIAHGEVDAAEAALASASHEEMSAAVDTLFVRAALIKACADFAGQTPVSDLVRPHWCEPQPNRHLRELCEAALKEKMADSAKALAGKCGVNSAVYYNKVNAKVSPIGKDLIARFAGGLAGLGGRTARELDIDLRQHRISWLMMDALAEHVGWAHIHSRGVRFMQVAAEARKELDRLAAGASEKQLDDLRSATQIASLPPGGGELLRYLALLQFDDEEDPHWKKVLWNRVGPFILGDILKRQATGDDVEFQRARLAASLPKHLTWRLQPLRLPAGEALGEAIRRRLTQSKQQAHYSRSTTKAAST